MIFLKVKVFPESKKNRILEKGDSVFGVYTKETPVMGKANEAALILFAAHLGIPTGKLRIVRGGHRRQKIIKVI